jgi:chemotaxis protein MotB
MSRKKKHAEHANHERWLVSYADFITLLFAFFVVMFASSQVDKRKVGKIALAVQVAFQQLGIFESGNARMPLSQSESMPFSDVQLAESVMRTADLGRIVDSPKGTLARISGVPNENDIQKQLEKALAPEIRQRDVSLKPTREGLILSLSEIGFFDSGSATLKSEALPTMRKIAAVLGPGDEFLRIEGHTDNVPIHNSEFASNWELSTARATKLVSFLISTYGFAPSRLSAAGYAEFHPVTSNATPEGRAMNRRVDIVILRARQGVPIGRNR